MYKIYLKANCMDFIDIHIHLQDYKTNFAIDIVKKAQTLNYKKLLCAGISEKIGAKLQNGQTYTLI